MSESICRFIPERRNEETVKTIHFVYETEHKTLRQPFVHPFYYVYLVTNGKAILRMAERELAVKEGDLFFSFAGVPFETAEDEDFKYLYISFTGKGVKALLDGLGVRIETPVCSGFSHLFELWFSAIARANDKNAVLLSEGVLRYTLSFLAATETDTAEKNDTVATLLIDYVNNHFAEETLSLGRVAELFSYTEKYVSYLFKKQVGIGFSQYLADMRLSHALTLIHGGKTGVADVARACGYRDALYFSKVFKKKYGHTPSEAMEAVTNAKK